VTSRHEAERIYAALFREPVPDIIAERFGYASSRLDDIAEPGELREYRHALVHIADLEALEVAGRFSKRLGILSRKFHLMVCLAETIPRNRNRFIKEKNSIPAAYAALIAGAFRTAIKIIKGLLLLRRMKRV
jgi:hypothetical protein